MVRPKSNSTQSVMYFDEVGRRRTVSELDIFPVNCRRFAMSREVNTDLTDGIGLFVGEVEEELKSEPRSLTLSPSKAATSVSVRQILTVSTS